MNNFLKILYILTLAAMINLGFLFFQSMHSSNRQESSGIIQEYKPEVIKIKGDSKQKQCLLEAMWYEARNQDIQGMKAVANVIINRTKSKHYPDTICEVVHQRKQFSYRNHLPANKPMQVKPKPSELELHAEAKTRVNTWFEKGFEPMLRSEVLWYHTTSVKPYWSKTKDAVRQIGDHVFYRKPENNPRNP